MQPRRASKSAAAATSSVRTRSAAAAAVKPSPPRKKPKTQTSLCSRHKSSRSITSSSENNIREEMRGLVLSHVNFEANTPTNGNSIDTDTIGGWCVVDGLTHCAMVSNGILLPLIREHGPPCFYLDHINSKRSSLDDETSENASNIDACQSFRDLCRIVSGQQLAGSAAKTIWRRLLKVVDATEENSSNLTPDRILRIVENGDVEADLRAPSGLSNAKCKCIVAIATSFKEGALSDNILLGEATDEVCSRLLSIKGLGPWSVDMFLLFQCHRSDILPIGDLAFRNGTSKVWGVKGRAKGGGLCQKKDEQVMKELHGPFAPYRSISSYYMYKCSGMK